MRREPSRHSQSGRILALLRQKPRTAAELEQLAGRMRVNSRIAELRKMGWNIPPAEYVAGARGAAAYLYRLVDGLGEGDAATCGLSSPSPSASAVRPSPVRTSAGSTAVTSGPTPDAGALVQLTLDEVAA